MSSEEIADKELKPMEMAGGAAAAPPRNNSKSTDRTSIVAGVGRMSKRVTEIIQPKHRRKQHHVRLRDGRRMNYIVDGPLDLELNPSKIKSSGLPVLIAFHGMYLSGESLVKTDQYRRNSSFEEKALVSMTTDTKNDDYVVVAINRAGYHGSSDVNIENYSYKEFALDVGEIADSLGIETFGVIGHSSGGPCALACAAILGPDRVKSFATLGGDPEYNHFDDIPYDCTMDCCIGKWLPRFLLVLLPCKRVANGMRNDYIQERLAYPFEVESIEQPGVVIAGKEDNLLPGNLTKRVNDRLPNSEYKVIPCLGHEDMLLDEPLDAACRTVVELMDDKTEKSVDGKKSDLAIDKLIRKQQELEDKSKNSTQEMSRE